MNTALLRQEQIEILRPEVTKTDFGEYFEVYKPIGTFRAGLLTQSMSRTVRNNEIVFPQSKTMVVRSYVPIREADHVLWNGIEWRAESIIHNKYFNDIEIVMTKVEK